jgi:MFS family permease
VVGFSALAWLPTLMMRRFAIDERFAGLVMAGAMLFTIPGALLGGVWADHWHSRHPAGRMRFAAFMVLLCTVGVVMAVGFIFLLHPGGIHDISIWFVVGALMLALFCAGSAAVNPAVMAATQSVVDREHKALVWGLGLSIMMVCGGAWAPAVAGNLSDRLGGHARGLSLALLLTSMLGFGGTGCLWKSACRYPAEVQAPVAGFSYLQRPGSLNAN